MIMYYDSPFHVTHDKDTADKMASTVDLCSKISSILSMKNYTNARILEKLNINLNELDGIFEVDFEKVKHLDLQNILNILESE